MGRSRQKKKKAPEAVAPLAHNTRSHGKQSSQEIAPRKSSEMEIVTVDFKSRLLSKLGPPKKERGGKRKMAIGNQSSGDDSKSKSAKKDASLLSPAPKESKEPEGRKGEESDNLETLTMPKSKRDKWLSLPLNSPDRFTSPKRSRGRDRKSEISVGGNLDTAKRKEDEDIRTADEFDIGTHGKINAVREGEKGESLAYNVKGVHQESMFSLKDPNSVLITLNHPQEFCFKGKCEISVVVGEVMVLGFKIKPGAAPYRMYSPDSSSLLLVKTAGDRENIDVINKTSIGVYKDSDALKKRTAAVKNFLKNEDSEILTGVLHEMTQQSVVLHFKQLDSLCCDYVSSISPFQNLFSPMPQSTTSDINLDIGVQIIHDRPPAVLEITENYEYVSEMWCSAIEGCHDPGPVVVLCGGKNMGKSTLGRYLVNSALNCCKEVCYLECDIGQSEFSLQGCVTLNSVTEPLLGPPFTHQQEPVCSTFVGCASPAEDPNHYVNCVKYVFNQYKSQFSTTPLIVNTMGWNKGLGLNLLVDVLRTVRPHFVVQLDSAKTQSKNLPPVTSNFVQATQGWTDMEAGTLPDEEVDDGLTEYSHKLTIIESANETQLDRKGRYSAPDTRAMATIAYLSRLHVPSSEHFVPINAHQPFMVSWRSVAVHVSGSMVPPSQVMHALNGSLVALCMVDQTLMLPPSDPELPRFLTSTPVCQCLGFGIIRGIDPVKKVFYIITPLSSAVLEKVNCLVKGSLDIPHQMLLKQKCPGPLPYVDSPRDGLGAGSVKPRQYLQRKKYSKSLLDNL
ncbi:polynucleotide 5'-hydroxyl-kinase NOL9 [Lingula anatina]|uniref:Polynucleotide 5'-hydroxyl-kinase NOL9 n=1 Tax=Lingula anatina TaxID=7574 RepID=A0A1S3K2V2_LINAN|nr:polynucleotide 5'-hydroxyl-kinase NOL9 [Lingula anatina]XP_013416971.1 polynucleotide 5'-hydroxyl-kinase NOL9 [Lingula anatina]|eukprot:XP_013416970.1 polynucleotide 5'-hydroxyl-kinase NOL9 [Lingula anatina]